MYIYASIDRARLLRYPLPYMRIIRWARAVPGRLAGHRTATSRLTEALLLASLIVYSNEDLTPYLGLYTSPSLKCDWQGCLRMAREIMKSQGISYKIDQDDHECCFLARWFSRLDVFGSFSDSTLGSPLPLDSYWPWEGSKDLQLDCLLGTSRSCISVLAKIVTTIHWRRQLGNEHILDRGPADARSLRILQKTLQHGSKVASSAVRSMCPDIRARAGHLDELNAIDSALQGTANTYLWQLLPREKRSLEYSVRMVRGIVYIGPESSSYDCTLLLPMLLAANLTDEAKDLVFITSKLEIMKNSGINRVSRSYLTK